MWKKPTKILKKNGKKLKIKRITGQKPSKISKNRQKYQKTLTNPSKKSKNRQKHRKILKNPQKCRKTINNF